MRLKAGLKGLAASRSLSSNSKNHIMMLLHAVFARACKVYKLPVNPTGSYLDDSALRRRYKRALELRLVREWAGLHRDELLANWSRAHDYEPLAPIDPLA